MRCFGIGTAICARRTMRGNAVNLPPSGIAQTQQSAGTMANASAPPHLTTKVTPIPAPRQKPAPKPIPNGNCVAVHLQTLDLIPSGAGFPARYASTIIWRKGMSYPLEPPFLGCGRKRESLNTRSTLATPFFRRHLATSSSLRRASILMRMRR